MSCSSTRPETTTKEGPAPGQGSTIGAVDDPPAAHAREMRRRGILALCSENDPAQVSAIVDSIVSAQIAAARMMPEYFTVAQLQARYNLTRKSVERLDIPRSRFGGAVRYARAEVLTFEQKSRVVEG